MHIQGIRPKKSSLCIFIKHQFNLCEGVNSLPANIVNVPTVNLFKSVLNKVNFNNVLQLLTE